MSRTELETFQLTGDCTLFSDKGVFRKKRDHYIGSRARDLCYKIPSGLYEILTQVIDPLKKFGAISAYQNISDSVSYEQYLKIIEKLDELGFNSNAKKDSLSGDRFDETELTMIRLFSVKGQHLNFQPVVSYSLVAGIYAVLLSALAFLSILYTTRSGIKVIDSAELVLLPYLVAYLISYLTHESAHIFVARLLQIPIKSLTCAFYFDVIPVVFLKYDQIRFFSRGKRVRVSLAGVSANLVLLCAGILCCSFDRLQSFGAAMIYVNFMMIISCLLPLKLGDGYFALCDLFGIDNLRKTMYSFLLEKNRRKHISALHVIYIFAFLLFNIAGISLFLFSAYKLWCRSTLPLRILLLIYLFFSVLVCGTVFAIRVSKKRNESRQRNSAN